MARIERFEDLLAWQRSMDLVVRVYELSSAGRFAKDFALADQIHRAAISVPSNIAEGFERRSRAEFHHSLTIAKGSCGEVRTQLHIAQRLGYITSEVAAVALTQAEDVSRIISRLRTTVARQRDTAKRSGAR
jgi:four helix bundle protein